MFVWIHLFPHTTLVVLLTHPWKSALINMSSERHTGSVIQRAQHYSPGPRVHGHGMYSDIGEHRWEFLYQEKHCQSNFQKKSASDTKSNMSQIRAKQLDFLPFSFVWRRKTDFISIIFLHWPKTDIYISIVQLLFLYYTFYSYFFSLFHYLSIFHCYISL